MSEDREHKTVKVEVTDVTRLQEDLERIKDNIRGYEIEENNARNKVRYLNNPRPPRRDRGSFRDDRMPPRDRDDRRGGDRRGRGRDMRDRRRGGDRDRRYDRRRTPDRRDRRDRGDRGDRDRGDRDRGDRDRGDRDRRGSDRDRFGRREPEREEPIKPNYYGLARSGDKKNREAEGLYKSQYATAESSSDDDDLPPTQMMSLVQMDSDKEDLAKNSDSDSDSSEHLPKPPKNEPIRRGRKRGRSPAGPEERKRRRVNILASLKDDKKNNTRSKRLFGFMMKHLGRAKKESKKKPDLLSVINRKAKELKEEQKHIIDSDFVEHQKEKYRARAEFQRKKKEIQIWRKNHIMNLLRCDGMKQEIKSRYALIDEMSVLLTKCTPPIAWKPAGELEPELKQQLEEKCKENLQIVMDQEIQEMMDNEGEEPDEPEPLARKYMVSPVRGRRDDDKFFKSEGKDGRPKKFGSLGTFKREPSRRGRSKEKGIPGKEISTSSLRNRQSNGVKDEPAVKPEPTNRREPRLMTLISMADE